VQAQQLLRQSVSSTISQAYEEMTAMEEHGMVVREEERVGIHAVNSLSQWWIDYKELETKWNERCNSVRRREDERGEERCEGAF
jgi:hypothetical protein